MCTRDTDGSRWVSSMLRMRERFDEPVDEQPVLAGVDVRNTRVVTLEVQRGRGDDAMRVLQRREGPRRLFRLRSERHTHRRLEPRSPPVLADRASQALRGVRWRWRWRSRGRL